AFVLLTVLGMAIGVSAADVGTGTDTHAQALGVSAGVWSAVTLLIALFIGGLVATRSGMVLDGATGVIEGVLIWVLSMLALAYTAGSGVNLLAGGVFGRVSHVSQGATAAARNLDVDALSSGDADQIAARLKDAKTKQLVAAATGMPETEVRSTLNDVATKVDA